MKTCKGCKWAEWQKTSNGRLHPSGDGKCAFPVKVPVLPYSVGGTYRGKEAIQSLRLIIDGRRYIDRNTELSDHCPCYAPEVA